MLKKIKERIAQMDHWTDKDETRATVQNLIRDELYMNIPDSIPPQQIQFMITLTIISFSSGLDSAIMMVRATKVWSSRVLLPSVS